MMQKLKGFLQRFKGSASAQSEDAVLAARWAALSKQPVPRRKRAKAPVFRRNGRAVA